MAKSRIIFFRFVYLLEKDILQIYIDNLSKNYPFDNNHIFFVSGLKPW